MRRKCKECVCNRDGGVMGVAEGRLCKMCVCNRGGPREGGSESVTHTHCTPSHSADTLNPPTNIT